MRALVGFGFASAVALMAAPPVAHADEWVGASFDVGGSVHGYDGVMSAGTIARFAIRFPLGIYTAFSLENGRVWSDAPRGADGESRDRVRATTLVLGVRRGMGVVSFAGDLGMGQHVFYADDMDLTALAKQTLPTSLVLHGHVDLWLTRYTTVGVRFGAAVAGEREQIFAVNAGLQFGTSAKQRAVFAMPWEQRSGARDLR